MAKKPMHSDSSDEHESDDVCEHRSGPIAGTAVLTGDGIGRKALNYANVDGLAIFEGDIILGTVEEVEAALQAGADAVKAILDAGGVVHDAGPVLESIGISAGVNRVNRWPNGRIPYQIASSLTSPNRVTDAIAHWESRTRIRFVLRTPANATQFPDYVEFVGGSGCSSQIGHRGGRQIITLGTGCSTGNAIHEIGHTIGLWHEQSREDRDTFVRIQWANITSGMEHNFDQHIADGDDLGPYDYGSIMHYPLTAFSVNGQPTIVTLQTVPGGVAIGQRSSLSTGDVNGVHQMYPLTTTRKELAKDPIFDPPTRKELAKDPVRDPIPTIKEVARDPIPTIKEVARDPLPTIKEVARDPGGTIFETIGSPGGTPFIMGSPSQFAEQPTETGSDLYSQLAALNEAANAMQQQSVQLANAVQILAQQISAGNV